MTRHRSFCAVPLIVATGCLLAGAAQTGLAAAPSSSEAPSFEVDPMWPRPLPNRWLVGAVVGVAVDAKDHVWIVHRPGTLQPNETRSIWTAAPPVLEFDPEGELVSANRPRRITVTSS